MQMNLKLLWVLILILLLGIFGMGQGTGDENNSVMQENIKTIYRNGGERGLREFLKKDLDTVDDRLIAILSKAGEKEKNEDLLNIALIIAEEKRNENYVAFVYFMKGSYYLSAGNIEKMIEHFEKALPIFEKIDAPGADQYFGILKKITLAFKNNLDELLNVKEELDKLYNNEEDIQKKGSLYIAAGNLYAMRGDSKKALEMFQKAGSIFENDINGQGEVYVAKGLFYSLNGDLAKTLEMYDNASTLFEKSGDYKNLGELYIRKGNIYYYTHDFLNANEMYSKAFSILKKLNAYSSMAEIYHAQGNILQEEGEEIKAIEKLDQALVLFKKENNYGEVENIYFEKGNIYFQKQDYASAKKMIEIALSFSEKSGNHFLSSRTYFAMGIIRAQNNDNYGALEMMEKAIQLEEIAGDPRFYSSFLIGKAKVLDDLGKKDEANILFEKAIAKLEIVRSFSFFPWMKKSFMEAVYNEYGETAAFMIKNKEDVKAFKYAELMKSRAFVDQMAESIKKVEKGLNHESKVQRDNLVLKLSSINKKMAEHSRNDLSGMKELNNEYQKAENEYKVLIEKIRRESPEYAAIQYPDPTSIYELQKEVLKEGEVLLRYFISQGNVFVFVVTKADFKVIKLETNENKINGMINRYLLSLMENKNNEKKVIKGKEFYELVFKPLEGALKGKTNIILVPDGNLELIPFESFVINDSIPQNPVYLLEKYRIQYIQSATVLAFIRKNFLRENQSNAFIGFGDPVYDYENFKQGKEERGATTLNKGDEFEALNWDRYAREGGFYNRLQYTGEEINTIAGLFKNKSLPCSVYLRDQATEDVAKSPEMKKYGFIHIASHGVSGENYQGLVLSKIPNAKEDGFFTMNEIMNCEFNARLVVLSACETGLGKMERGEGVTGLTRAVMYAGSPAVVVSLWNVNDAATKELMVRFYTNILERGLSKEEALRQAKLELMNSEKYSSPFFWSSFVMYGK